MVGKRYLIVIVIVVIVSVAVILYESRMIDTCKIQQLDIESKISKYEKTKDPLLCSSLNDIITQFNLKCKSDLEIQDCG